MYRVPTVSGKQGKKIMVREKSGNFVLNCRLPFKFAVILVDYRECLSRYSPIWKCTCEFKRMFVFFIVFKCYISSIKYNIQISYGMSYFKLRDSSDIFTCDIHVARQSVVDRMVREISLEVREKSGESQGKVREFIFLVVTLMYTCILTSVQHILK